MPCSRPPGRPPEGTVLDVPHDGYLGDPGHTDTLADVHPAADTDAHADRHGDSHTNADPDRCFAGGANLYADTNAVAQQLFLVCICAWSMDQAHFFLTRDSLPQIAQITQIINIERTQINTDKGGRTQI
jgi:hypothetical protein